jgi:RNA polymerase sigma factor (sigma-70 family)
MIGAHSTKGLRPLKPSLVSMGATPREIERVYRRRYGGFVGAVTAIVRSREDAAEVVQDGFAQALARRREFRGDGPLEAWIWSIVLRKAFDRLASTRPVTSLDEVPEVALPDPEADSELEAALRQLPPRKRLVVYLHYLADLPYSAVAEICGISEGTVAATLSQARAALADSLDQRRPETARTARRTR